ncbi:hypothetical protein A3Q56_07202 [Intoshia linei]|uniref:Uncharacterized protein n=1 Tax=Intoshia linei TaxID=1819745 RepID=A0A177AUM7_9BILA|nr:hypothetical protein A3Q56_07202 [Intoshia linei]
MLKKNGDSYSPLEAIAIMKEFPHEIVANDLCATCGIDMSNRYSDNIISMIHDNLRIKFAEKYAEQKKLKGEE